MGQGEITKALAHMGESTPQISIDAVPHMVWSARADGYNNYHNERWCEFTGIAPHAANGEEWINLVHPDDREAILAAWQDALDTGSVCEVEHRLLHHSGEYRWVLGRAMPIHDPQGRIERWIGTYTDIHAWKKTQRDLAESEERYRALVEAMTEMVWRAAPDGSILRGWGWEEFCGQKPEEYEGYGWLDAVHPEDRERVIQVWLEEIAPHAPTSHYRHNRTGEDNADAHMKRQIMGREVVVAITKGKLDFGPWEQIFYGEFDGRRVKRVLVKIVGE